MNLIQVRYFQSDKSRESYRRKAVLVQHDIIFTTTPEYQNNCYEYRDQDSADVKVMPEGDTVVLASRECRIGFCESGKHFRTGDSVKSIIFLMKKDDQYENIYVMQEISDENLKFLNEVKTKGEDYFKTFN